MNRIPAIEDAVEELGVPYVSLLTYRPGTNSVSSLFMVFGDVPSLYVEVNSRHGYMIFYSDAKAAPLAPELSNKVEAALFDLALKYGLGVRVELPDFGNSRV